MDVVGETSTQASRSERAAYVEVDGGLQVHEPEAAHAELLGRQELEKQGVGSRAG